MRDAPVLAPVRPRVLLPLTGEAAPLEEEVRALLDRGVRGWVAVLGNFGAGKTTALRHLRAALPVGALVQYFDDLVGPRRPRVVDALFIYTGPRSLDLAHAAEFKLVPWTLDDALEYLLAVHRGACSSVMDRLAQAQALALLEGSPQLWSAMLDEMAGDPALLDPLVALDRRLRRRLEIADVARMRRCALALVLRVPTSRVDLAAGEARSFTESGGEETMSFLRHLAPRLVPARDAVLADLASGVVPGYLSQPFPPAFLQILGAALRLRPGALDLLRSCVEDGDSSRQATAASLMHAAGASWDTAWSTRAYDGARLSGIHWTGADLTRSRLSHADLSHARLDGARLSRALLRGANLSRARMAGAWLEEADLGGADLTGACLYRVHGTKAFLFGACLANAELPKAVLCGADLEAADLRGACFAGADLREATLERALVEGADFTGADLQRVVLVDLVKMSGAVWKGARFFGAALHQCRMAGVDLTGADFEEAHLVEAELTGSLAPGVNFRRAVLQGARLADIDWPGADLRSANMNGVSFHMGSTRSGLLFTPMASEGTRTGFYDDDYVQHRQQIPERIRTANLRGADLRGASLYKSDFYLVDLREAKLDSDQIHHVRRCGAILR